MSSSERGTRRTEGDPCGDKPLHLPTPEETFADLIAEQAAAREEEGKDIGMQDKRRTPASASLTLSETGWARLDNQTMRWISEPIAEGAGRHVLQLKGYERGLGITAAWLPPDVDPADAEDVADELEDAWPAVLPLAALIVLRTALDTVIAAIEGAQADPQAPR